ncbi:RNA polymerase sigma factor [Salimicrobium halophilum]|uniref:RNA polymerase sigma-70 factor, ECF subfamily n=1 Tax=Salimicrobium halophilum TaxID=86666 RepID=A0A1G8RH06_9BACI|nr:sigma-70 family RNA polymerase sigma factor [Salimicrobium halophilum]SDJ16143.1 RNA polymerase sigma-70 factor, ECF subfamily [Salimicrobium halophilum]
MSTQDEELYRRVLHKDKDALETLYDKYEKLLFSFSYKMTNNHGLSEEVVQDVFMKLWTQKGTYDSSKGKFSSWLLTIARNAAVDLMRKKKDTPYELEERDALQTNEPSVEEMYEWKEEATAVREAMRVLNDNQQRAIQLFYFDAKSHREIAEQLGVPLGTVKGRIRMALKHLQTEMNRREGGKERHE